MNLNDKVVVVTGAASGLGLATCRALRDAGARVVGLDLDQARLDAALGGEILGIAVDVANEASVKAGIDQVMERFGALHVAVNCAGILGPSKTLSKGQLFPSDLWHRVLAVNLTGTFNVIRHAALAMTANEPEETGERGVIVNTASGAAREGQMGQAAYSASKAGVIGFSRSVALAYAAKGIRCNTVVPGLMHTPLVEHRLVSQLGANDAAALIAQRNASVPVGHMGTGWDVAHAVLFLASDEAKYVTATEVVVDGGLTAAAPGGA